LRLLILVAREGFLEDKCGPRAKKFEHHCSTYCNSNKHGETGLTSWPCYCRFKYTNPERENLWSVGINKKWQNGCLF